MFNFVMVLFPPVKLLTVHIRQTKGNLCANSLSIIVQGQIKDFIVQQILL